jgi:predicted dinucleotide-binding enzyme
VSKAVASRSGLTAEDVESEQSGELHAGSIGVWRPTAEWRAFQVKRFPLIGVLGSGPVGRGVATLLARAGYKVTLGTRHPDSLVLLELPATVTIGTFDEAAKGDVVFLAVVHSASRALVESLAEQLAGKILVDADNEWARRHYAATGLSDSLTEGSWMASLLPGSSVVRAFSHIDWDLLVTRATDEPGVWAVGYASDDDHVDRLVETLIWDMGYVPVKVGSLAESAPIDPGGVLWPRMLTPDAMRALLDTGEESS